MATPTSIVIGSLLSASVKLLLEKIVAPYMVQFFKGKKPSSSARCLQDMKMKFLALSAVLADAEQKQNKVPGVKEWLEELKDAVDDAEDLFGEIENDAMKLEMEKEKSRTMATKMSNKLSKLVKLTDKIKRNNEMEEILRRLDQFEKQISFLHLVSDARTKEEPMEMEASTSLLDEAEPEPEVYGVETEKDALMKALVIFDKGDKDRKTIID